MTKALRSALLSIAEEDQPAVKPSAPASEHSDAPHKLSTGLIDGNRVIYVDDLSVEGTVRRRHPAQTIAQNGFGDKPATELQGRGG